MTQVTMSIANKRSRSPVANGGFGDPDLTPKPLRISKREHPGTCTARGIDTLHSSLSARSQIQRTSQTRRLTPTKRCSTRVNSAPLDLSLQDLAAPISQWARRNTFLHVHKQRQSEPINPNPAARSRDSCLTMGQLGSSSDASNSISVARPASVRALSTGNLKRPNPLSPVPEVSRRAVTNVEAFCINLDKVHSLPYQGLRKQRSTKNSLMSRMMSGLTNRNPRTREDMQAFSQFNFPTPASDPISPTTAESLAKSTRFRELYKPADAVLMGAELTLTPEYDRLTPETERSMLVSLDIKGTTNSASGVQDMWSQHTGLDVVVIIDNS